MIASSQHTITDLRDIETGDTEPSNPVLDQLWMDTGVVPNLLMRYDGIQWIETGLDINEFADEINTTIQTLSTEIQGFDDKILITASDLIADERDNILSEMRTDLTTTSQGLSVMIGKTNDRISDTNDELETINANFDFRANGLTIGKSNSDLSITISNSEMVFNDGGTDTARISGQIMTITKLRILSDLVIGVHQIEKYSENMTIIKHVGGGN